MIRFGLCKCAVFVACFLGCAALPHPVVAQTPDAGTAGDSSTVESDESKAAVLTSAIPNSPQEVVKAIGWPFALVFGAASIVAMWCGIERLVLLRHRRVIPRAFVDRFLQHLRSGRMDKTNAIAVCQQDGSPMADVLLHGLRK